MLNQEKAESSRGKDPGDMLEKEACSLSLQDRLQSVVFRFSICGLSRLSIFPQTFCERYLMPPGVIVHACNPSTWEAEAGGLRV
jgi:hypothetical protein